MIGFLTTRKCAICDRRLWLLTVRQGIAAMVCPPCDLRPRVR